MLLAFKLAIEQLGRDRVAAAVTDHQPCSLHPVWAGLDLDVAAFVCTGWDLAAPCGHSAAVCNARCEQRYADVCCCRNSSYRAAAGRT